MPFGPPDLDTRTFADLVHEAKQRIPRYLPEWTDLNESDPGIALVELFAWMTEVTLYELNQAPEALRLKLLQLLGYRTRPAQAARTELQFSLSAAVDKITIPLGTRVAASGATHPDGSPVIFETDRSIVAIGPTLSGALAVKPGLTVVGWFSDPTKTKAPTFEPFPTMGASAGFEGLYLCFSHPTAFPPVDVDLAFFLQDAPGEDFTYECTMGHPPTPPAEWAWSYLGSAGWAPVETLGDSTSALYRSGHVSFRFPDAPKEVKNPDWGAIPGVPPDFLELKGYWVRAQLTEASYEQAPVVVAITTNTAPATQALTVTDETVGGSAGTAGQTFTLKHSPVLPATLELTVDEGLTSLTGQGGSEAWVHVDDFYGQMPDAHAYTLDPASGVIGFGDNHFGAIPIANQTTPNNIVANHYRYGGGVEGNVDVDLITDIQSYIAHVDKVTNPIAGHGGSDEEAVADTALRAGHSVRATNRAVTADDFEALGMETPGALVARVHTLPLTHPAYPQMPVPGCVTVLVVPKRREDDDVSLQTDKTPPPSPNRTTVEAVCAQLDAHRLVTTELHVTGPHYRIVEFAMVVHCRPDADLAAVATTMKARLRALYAPVGPNGGWPWGQTAYSSVAFATAMEVDGVSRIDSFTMSVDSVPVPMLGEVPLGPTEMFWVPEDKVLITPRYETGL